LYIRRLVASGAYRGGVTGPLETIAAAKYALLTTYRKDGRAVPTPVWIGRLDDDLVVWSVADAGKVKRIRRRPEVTVATCDFRGNRAGPGYRGRAELVPVEESQRVRRALARKYGLVGRVSMIGSRLRRGRFGAVGLRIRLDPPDQPA
jgi:PPOX class probable F420-dependent enzyme